MTNAESPQKTATLTIDQALQQATAHHQAGQLQDAKRLYRAILQTQPNHPDANHNLGVLAVQAKQPAAGLPHLKAALEANPKQGQYWLSYIDALIQTCQIVAARQVLEQGRQRGLQREAVEALADRINQLEKTATDQTAELKSAIAHREAGRHKESALVLQSWLVGNPQDATAYALLAQVLSLDKQDEPAWVALNTALTINPALPIAQRNHVRLLLKRQKLDEALQVAQAAYQNDATDPENQLVLASALAANNQKEQALPLVENALQIRPNYAEAFATRALFKLRGNDFAGALVDAEKALSIKPHLSQLWGVVSSLRYKFKDLPSAIDALEKGLDYDPDNVEYLVNLGEFKRQAGAVEAAIVLLEKATTIAPDDASAWVNLGTAFQESQRIPEAQAAYAKALEIAPGQAEVACNLGVLAKEEGKLEEALRCFNQALEYQPTSVVILTNKAAVLNNLERYGEAEQAALQAIEVEPAHIEAHLVESRALIGQKNYEAAQAVLDTLKHSNVSDIRNAFQLALSYTALFSAKKQWADAEAWVRGALEIRPKDVKVLRQLASILGEQKHYESAWATLLEALENTPEDAVTLRAMASHHAKLQDWPAAEAWVRRALEIKPKDVKALRQLGAILDEQMRCEDAWAMLLEALENAPEDVDTLQVMANHHARLQHWPEAEVWVRRALKIDPNYAEAHFTLGNVLKELGRQDAAEASYRRALEIKPDYAEAHNNLGAILKMLSRLGEAEASYRLALKAKPDYADAFGNLGGVLMSQGKLDDALACFQQQLKLMPENGVAQYQIASLTGNNAGRAPIQYVENLFDGYADRFDTHLQQTLKYEAPEKLVALILRYATPPDEKWNVLDLGCGTGLVGLAIAPFSQRLVGVDLSSKMLKKAHARNLYQRLECLDLLTMMQAESTASYDVIIAADVFVYLGKLDEIIRETKRLLCPGGIFAFSVEALGVLSKEEASQGIKREYQLENTGRFSHSANYIARLASENGFLLQEMAATQIRINHGKPVNSHLVLLKS